MLYTQKQKVSKNIDDITLYKRFKNKLTKKLKNAERQHYASLLKEHQSDIKKSWNVLKNVLNRNKPSSTCTRFKHNGKMIDD